MSGREEGSSAPIEVHWGSDTGLEQVPGVSTSDILGISLCQRHLAAVLKINCTEVNSGGELLFRYSTQQEIQCVVFL